MNYNPQESLENAINTMGTLVHPIVPWKYRQISQSLQGFIYLNRWTLDFPTINSWHRPAPGNSKNQQPILLGKPSKTNEFVP